MIKNETHRKNIQKFARSNGVGTRNLLELLERGFDLTLLGTANIQRGNPQCSTTSSRYSSLIFSTPMTHLQIKKKNLELM